MDDLNAALQGTGLAVFEDRIIYDAQPPVTADVLAAIAARCRGPIPQGLLDLWSVTFGGSLDYELFAPLGEDWTWLSFAELFYPDSGRYHDLWGWIEHDADLATEAADERGEAFDGLLDYLPFGGFEYLERLYVRTTPGPDHGKVIAWIQGLPPAWGGKLGGDDVAIPVADSVPELFRALGLAVDPFGADAADADNGPEMAEAIDEALSGDPQTHATLRALIAASIKPRPSRLVRA